MTQVKTPSGTGAQEKGRGREGGGEGSERRKREGGEKQRDERTYILTYIHTYILTYIGKHIGKYIGILWDDINSYTNPECSCMSLIFSYLSYMFCCIFHIFGLALAAVVGTPK